MALVGGVMSKSGSAVGWDGRTGPLDGISHRVLGPQGPNYSGNVAQDDELSKGNLEKVLTANEGNEERRQNDECCLIRASQSCW